MDNQSNGATDNPLGQTADPAVAANPVPATPADVTPVLTTDPLATPVNFTPPSASMAEPVAAVEPAPAIIAPEPLQANSTDQVETLSADLKTIQDDPKAPVSVEAPQAPVSAAAPEPVKAETPSEPEAKESKEVATDSSIAPPPPPMVSGAPTGVGMRDIAKKSTDQPAPKSVLATTPLNIEKPASDSMLGKIGEIVSIVGIVIFALLLVEPFYRSALSSSLVNTLNGMGWLISLAALLIGFLLSLFVKGKWTIKIVTIVLFILALVFYLGLNNSSSSLGTALSSILVYYR